MFTIQHAVTGFKVTPEPVTFIIPIDRVRAIVGYYHSNKVTMVRDLRDAYPALGLKDAKEIIEAVLDTAV